MTQYQVRRTLAENFIENYKAVQKLMCTAF